MNKRRLLKLADLLEADAKKKTGMKFDIHTWGFVKTPAKPVSCGTHACAMGLAALSGAFKRQGLTAKIDSGVVLFKWKSRVTDDGFVPAKALFDLSFAQADHLFGPFQELPNDGQGAEAARAVAKKIRDLCDGKPFSE